MNKQWFEFYDGIDDVVAETIGKLFSLPPPGEMTCIKQSSSSGFDCTRPKGHSGFHLAHDMNELACAIWRDEDE